MTSGRHTNNLSNEQLKLLEVVKLGLASLYQIAGITHISKSQLDGLDNATIDWLMEYHEIFHHVLKNNIPLEQLLLLRSKSEPTTEFIDGMLAALKNRNINGRSLTAKDIGKTLQILSNLINYADYLTSCDLFCQSFVKTTANTPEDYQHDLVDIVTPTSIALLDYLGPIGFGFFHGLTRATTLELSRYLDETANAFNSDMNEDATRWIKSFFSEKPIQNKLNYDDVISIKSILVFCEYLFSNTHSALINDLIDQNQSIKYVEIKMNNLAIIQLFRELKIKPADANQKIEELAPEWVAQLVLLKIKLYEDHTTLYELFMEMLVKDLAKNYNQDALIHLRSLTLHNENIITELKRCNINTDKFLHYGKKVSFKGLTGIDKKKLYDTLTEIVSRLKILQLQGVNIKILSNTLNQVEKGNASTDDKLLRLTSQENLNQLDLLVPLIKD